MSVKQMWREVIIRRIAPGDATIWEAMWRELWPDGAEDHGPEIALVFAGHIIATDRRQRES